MEKLSPMKLILIVLSLYYQQTCIRSADDVCKPNECGGDSCFINRCYNAVIGLCGSVYCAEGSKCNNGECDGKMCGYSPCKAGSSEPCQFDYCVGAGPRCGDGQCPKNTRCGGIKNDTCLPNFFSNIAMNQPALSKSVVNYSNPTYGNDFRPSIFISGTAGTPSATGKVRHWWCVNMGLVYDFEAIKLFNLYQLKKNRVASVVDNTMRGFEIRVSDVGACFEGIFNNAKLCYKDPTKDNVNAKPAYLIRSCNQNGVAFSGRTIYLSVEDNPLKFIDLAVYPKELKCKNNHHCRGHGVCVNEVCQIPKCNEKYCSSQILRF